MNDQSPRLAPLSNENAPEEAQEILANWPYNLHRTLAHNVPILTKWMPYAEHILRNNSLPEREREIAILRVAWNTQSAYEWGLHARLARSIGFSDADMENIARGTLRTSNNSGHWTDVEAALIDAVDDIMHDWKIGDDAWEVLAAEFSEPQLIDFLFVTSQFILVAVTLRSLQVSLEPGIESLPTI